MSSQVHTGRPAAKRKRGRETAADMLRSLGVVLLLVVALWFLAQPPDGDEQTVRVVDPTSDLAQLQAAAPGVPVPRGLPPQWRATSSTLDPAGLRIGYVTPGGRYAEYATATGPEVLADITGGGAEVGSLDVGGVSWRQVQDVDDHSTLVRDVAGRQVVVGGVRETATPDELRELAASVS